MKFKSLAQREKFKEFVKDGKITQAEFDKMDQETDLKKIPTKATYKPKGIVRGVRRTAK